MSGAIFAGQKRLREGEEENPDWAASENWNKVGGRRLNADRYVLKGNRIKVSERLFISANLFKSVKHEHFAPEDRAALLKLLLVQLQNLWMVVNALELSLEQPQVEL